MITFAIRRIAQLIPVLLVMSMIVFATSMMLPGDPTTAILGEDASLADRAALKAEMGLDQPIPVQYARWLGKALTGDLGKSLRTQEPVAQMLASRVPITLELALLAVIVSVLIGVPLGIFAALKRNSWIDSLLSAVSLSSMAIPYFWVGILLIMLLSVRLGWLPPSGYVPFFEDPIANLKLMIMPVITVGTAQAALVMRQTRTAMLQILSQDYIRTARAKGAGEGRVILSHALRNSMIPVITVVGLQMGALIGGAVVTETVFSLPGLGRMIVDGIFVRDFPVVQGAILVVVLGVLLVNLVTDLSYTLVDRRIKL